MHEHIKFSKGVREQIIALSNEGFKPMQFAANIDVSKDGLEKL
jgi:hypothetical protein